MQNKGWTVTLAGIGINLALGVLYTWSMFKGAIEKGVQVNLLINNRAGGNAPMIAQKVAEQFLGQ